ncbi:hypothetical protein ACFX16_031584 [Malus domestica]
MTKQGKGIALLLVVRETLIYVYLHLQRTGRPAKILNPSSYLRGHSQRSLLKYSAFLPPDNTSANKLHQSKNISYHQGCIRKVAKEVLGESKGFAPHQKESWWWNEEVQTKVKAKKECCKALYKERTDENGERYRKAKQEAKKAVREAKLAAYDDMYKRLDTKEGELDVYKLSRAREKKTRDLNQVRCIKDEDGKVLATENAVKDRWRGYFHNLFNEGHEMSASLGELSNSEECRNYSFYRRIRKE